MFEVFQGLWQKMDEERAFRQELAKAQMLIEQRKIAALERIAVALEKNSAKGELEEDG